MSELSKKKVAEHTMVLEKPWALALGAGVGIVTLIFLMALVIFAINDRPPPESVKYIIITIISFGLAFATAFLGGGAVIRGAIPFVPEEKASRFSIAGGVAVFLIVFVVMFKFIPPEIDPRDWDGRLSSIRSASAKISDVDDKMIVKVNGVILVDADYGFSGSFEFKDKLKVGENLIDVSILNSEYGGCSGTFEVYVNERQYGKFGRSYKNKFAAANQVCKSFVVDFPVK